MPDIAERDEARLQAGIAGATLDHVRETLIDELDLPAGTSLPDALDSMKARLDALLVEVGRERESRLRWAEESAQMQAERNDRPTVEVYEGACEALERRRVALVDVLPDAPEGIGFYGAVDAVGARVNELIDIRAAAHALLNANWSVTGPQIGWSRWPAEYGVLAEASRWRPPAADGVADWSRGHRLRGPERPSDDEFAALHAAATNHDGETGEEASDARQ